jgi:ABC-type lipoprotein release transport system permease subunit
MESEKFWTFLILVFILIIATFNIIGTLTMLIIEKKKDLHVLSAMGAGLKSIRRIFMIEGFMITLLGALFGLVLGLILCWTQMRYGLLRFDEGYIVDFYPMDIYWSDLITILAVVMLIGFFTAWYPVRKFTLSLSSQNDL